MTTMRRFIWPSLATVGAGWLAYASVTSPTIAPTGRWLVSLMLAWLVAVAWWGTFRPRPTHPQSYLWPVTIAAIVGVVALLIWLVFH